MQNIKIDPIHYALPTIKVELLPCSNGMVVGQT